MSNTRISSSENGKTVQKEIRNHKDLEAWEKV
jgi:hypothetical protein